MKRMKNLLSLVLALVMVMAMTLTAMASEAKPVTVKNETDHTYKAYQIFSGTQSGDTETALGNVEWGSGVDENAALAAVQAIVTSNGEKPFDACETAQDVADVLGESGAEDNEIAQLFAQAVSKKTVLVGTSVEIGSEGDNSVNLDPGYYLFVDESTGEGEDFYVNRNLLQVTGDGDIVIKQKTSIPTVDKQVKDNPGDKDMNSTDTEGWGETADYELFKEFEFKLTAIIPKDVDLASYKTYGKAYEVTFKDTFSKGVTYTGIESVVIHTVDGEKKLVDTEYSLDISNVNSEDEALRGFSVTINDVTELISANALKDEVTITVIYKAYLNENAMTVSPNNGNSGLFTGKTNENSVKLEYSNNPNVDGEGKGTTPEDHVWVFSYDMPNFKYTTDKNDPETKKAMEGAGFTLYRDAEGDGEVVETDAIPVVAVSVEGDVIGRALLVDATGEILSGDVGKAIWSTIDHYRVASQDEIDNGLSLTQMYSLSNEKSKGTFNVEGLDVGDYLLRETDTPNGYNTCEDAKIVISVSVGHFENGDENSANTHVVMTNGGKGTNQNEFLNQQGVTLPETGGIGTTIFTVSGIILVIIAGVLLVTKKRMSKEE